MTEKRCAACREVKSASEFYGSTGRGDNLTARCKECHNQLPSRAPSARQEERRQAAARSGRPYTTRAEQLAALARKREERAAARATAAEARRVAQRAARRAQWQPDAHYPGMDVVRARKKVANALALGYIVKPAGCSRCPRVPASPRLHAHHEDYEYPLAVEWLCSDCHSDLHGRTC